MPRGAKQDPPTAASRRSRRIASREASLEAEPLVSLPYTTAVCYSLAEQNRTQAIELIDLKQNINDMKAKRQRLPPISSNIINRELIAKYRQDYAREQEEELKAARATVASLQQVVAEQATGRQDFITDKEHTQSALSPLSSSSFNPSLEGHTSTPLVFTKTAATTAQQEAAQEPMTPSPAPTGWRRFMDLVSTPFVGRKRNADDMEETKRGPQRARIFTRPTLHEQERVQKRPRIATPPSPAEDPYIMSGALPAPETEAPVTGKVSHRDQTKSKFTLYSAGNFDVPTLLSTITEYTELGPTPSKPGCGTPPLPLASTDDVLPAHPSAPQDAVAPAETPRRRRWADRRRETLKRKATSSLPVEKGWEGVHPESGFLLVEGRKMSWEIEVAPPQPRLKNADERLAKIQRFRTLQRELEVFSRDQDIIDIVTRKTKRVKVDHLTSIPHNLPGDASSTFRVPEVDSDDEMSVGELDLMNSNMFLEPPEAHEHADVHQESSPSAPMVQTPAQPVSLPSVSAVTWSFPDVGLPASGYQVGEEYTRAACALFEDGFATWLAQRQ